MCITENNYTTPRENTSLLQGQNLGWNERHRKFNQLKTVASVHCREISHHNPSTFCMPEITRDTCRICRFRSEKEHRRVCVTIDIITCVSVVCRLSVFLFEHCRAALDRGMRYAVSLLVGMLCGFPETKKGLLLLQMRRRI